MFFLIGIESNGSNAIAQKQKEVNETFDPLLPVGCQRLYHIQTSPEALPNYDHPGEARFCSRGEKDFQAKKAQSRF
jgi:hypothetical protein